MTMKVFAVYNIKGGVGKTASAVNLAYLSASGGARTLIWDLDPQGAATFYFRIRPRVKGGGRKLIRAKDKARLMRHVRGTDFEGLDLLPADFSYRHLDLELDHTKNPIRRLTKVLAPLADEYDHVFLDCAPSISLVSESVFRAADVLLVPTIPTTLSLRTLAQLRGAVADIRTKRLDLLPFFCMVDRRKKLHRSVCADVPDGAAPLLATAIPYSSQVEQMGLHRAPVVVTAPRASASRAYRELWAEVRSSVGAG
jgi:cellulose biosynthesis protein BcsQ